MHHFFLAFLAFLVTSVAGAGVRNGYERVWLWYAYQIDLELPEDQRKVGVRCIKFNEGANTCPPTYEKFGRKGKSLGMFPNYEPCKGTREPGKHCYFHEFMGHIDKKGVVLTQNFYQPVSYLDPTEIKNDPEKKNTVEREQKNLNPDPKATAEWLNVEHPRPDGDKTANPVRTQQYRPYRAFKGATTVYNDMLRALADHSASTIAGFSDEKKAAMQGNIDKIKDSIKAVIIERKIDHSIHIIAANNAPDKQFKLYTYTEPGHTGNIVDWDKSEALQTGDNVQKFKDWRTQFYTDTGVSGNEGKKALEHLTVMQDFEYVERKYSSPGVCST